MDSQPPQSPALFLICRGGLGCHNGAQGGSSAGLPEFNAPI